MLGWAAVFFIISLVAAVFGFGITNDASGVCEILFFVFLILSIVSLGFDRKIKS